MVGVIANSIAYFIGVLTLSVIGFAVLLWLSLRLTSFLIERQQEKEAYEALDFRWKVIDDAERIVNNYLEGDRQES